MSRKKKNKIKRTREAKDVEAAVECLRWALTAKPSRPHKPTLPAKHRKPALRGQEGFFNFNTADYANAATTGRFAEVVTPKLDEYIPAAFLIDQAKGLKLQHMDLRKAQLENAVITPEQLASMKIVG